MTDIAYTVQRPGHGALILNTCSQLATRVTFDRVTGLYAFASYKGARLLVDALSSSPSWRRARKRWIISIDDGVTEPAALRFLLELDRSDVFVPNGEALLLSRLRGPGRFHPKTLLFESGVGKSSARAILVGSANLTVNGLSFGHEHALSASPSRTRRANSFLQALTDGIADVERVISTATQVNADFIDRYAAVRPRRPRQRGNIEDPRAKRLLSNHASIRPTVAANLAAATRFWIDVAYVVRNRGRNEEGNQIDLQKGSRVFFGFNDADLPPNSPIGNIVISYNGHSATRNLRYGHNHMDKLDLPIPGTEGPASYMNKTLLFTRERPGFFHLAIGSSSAVAEWKAQSSAAGSLFSMRGGREFGVF